jgi:hypothetical protein
LRKYLQKDENIRIENVHGIGFQFVCPDWSVYFQD